MPNGLLFNLDETRIQLLAVRCNYRDKINCCQNSNVHMNRFCHLTNVNHHYPSRSIIYFILEYKYKHTAVSSNNTYSNRYLNDLMLKLG